MCRMIFSTDERTLTTSNPVDDNGCRVYDGHDENDDRKNEIFRTYQICARGCFRIPEVSYSYGCEKYTEELTPRIAHIHFRWMPVEIKKCKQCRHDSDEHHEINAVVFFVQEHDGENRKYN